MTHITHLVTNGCSFTYCQGLPNPKEQGWPTLLAKKLNVPVVNLAIMGCGNGSIHRRTYEYVYENLPTGSRPFFVIAWSQYWRKEQWFNTLNNVKFNDYTLIAMPNDYPDTIAEKNLIEEWNDEDFYRRTVLNKLSLASLFNSFKIPYLMSDYSADEVSLRETNIPTKLPNMFNSCRNLITSERMFHEITRDSPKLPCGHDGLEAQSLLAEYAFNEIKRTYSNLEAAPTTKYLTLLEVFAKVNKQVTSVNHHWI